MTEPMSNPHPGRIAKRNSLVADIIRLEKGKPGWSDVWEALGLRQDVCSSCGAPVWWTVTRAGVGMPLSDTGVAHFADCPNAAKHRKAKA